jgi:nitrate/nitrite transporter NarK
MATGILQRPIFWSVLWFLVSLVLWINLSIVGGLIEGFSGERVQLLYGLVIFFGICTMFSLPIGVVVEILRWLLKKKEK